MKNTKIRKGLGLAVALTAGLVVSGQASADVYGLGYLDISDLHISFPNALPGSTPTTYLFGTAAEGTLNGADDPTSGSATCGGVFGVGGTCGAAGAGNVLSGAAQNAPGATGGIVRGNDDYTFYGTGNQYSNAEAAIIDAQLVGDASTHAAGISESNLVSNGSAQASTTVNSTTTLVLFFTIPDGMDDGGFVITFDAIWNAVANVTGGDLGLSQGNTGLQVALGIVSGGTTTDVAKWTPDGNEVATTCVAGLTCVADEAGSLNNAASSSGGLNDLSGSGAFSFSVSGLASGTYSLALNMTTSTLLGRFTPTPIPGTLLLMGIGLLAGTGVSRRRKLA